MTKSWKKVLCLMFFLAFLRVPASSSAEIPQTPEVTFKKNPDLREIVQEAFQSIDGKDNLSKATGLAYIGAFLGETGDTVGAEEALNKAFQITTAFQDSSQKDGALWQIGGSQAKTGDIKEALHTAAQIQSAYYKVATLSLIAEAQAKAGNKSDAKQTIAQALKISDEEDTSLAWIAAAQGRIGYLKDALLTAVRIENDGSFSGDKIREIVEAQIKAKNLKGALQAAHIIKDAAKKGQALSIVAIAQADSGDIPATKITISEALMAVNLNNNELDYAHILGAVAEAQVKIGDQIGANKTHTAVLQLADNIKGTIDSDSTLSDRAAIFAITGDIERALKITSSIHDDFHKQWALSRIANAQTKRGEIEGAIKTVSLIPNGNEKIRILMDIARLIHHRYSEKNGEYKSE